MRRGTKIGWILVAFSLVLSIWVIAGGSSDANQTINNEFVVSDDGTELIQYIGSGGSITIPDGVTTIDAGVFYNTSANEMITDVTMPNSVTTMGTAVFQGCTQLQSVSLSSNLTSIPANTFRECASLSSVSIPAGVTSIGSSAFYGCVSMSSVTIPSGTSSVALDAFSECTELTSISVASDNSYYSSADGCLYNASATRLLLVPQGKSSVSIASGATTIGAGAFNGCTYLTSLTIPSNVTAIEAGAFSGSGIATITIPASVTSIGDQSGWAPTTIYGYADSAAETYAMDHNIPFIVVGNSGNGGGDGTGGSGDGSGETGDGTTDGGNTGDGTTGDGTTGGGAAGDGTTTTGGSVDGTNTQAGGGVSHEKDATPTTADGIDTRYFLCLAIFLGGVGVIVFSRRNKMAILQEKSNRKE